MVNESFRRHKHRCLSVFDPGLLADKLLTPLGETT